MIVEAPRSAYRIRNKRWTWSDESPPSGAVLLSAAAVALAVRPRWGTTRSTDGSAGACDACPTSGPGPAINAPGSRSRYRKPRTAAGGSVGWNDVIGVVVSGRRGGGLTAATDASRRPTQRVADQDGRYSGDHWTHVVGATCWRVASPTRRVREGRQEQHAPHNAGIHSHE